VDFNTLTPPHHTSSPSPIKLGFLFYSSPMRCDWILFYGAGVAWGVRGGNAIKKGGGSLFRPSELHKLKIRFKGSPRPFFIVQV